MRFLGITLRVLRLEVSLHNDSITNKFQTTFAKRGGGGLVEVTVNSKEENLRLLSQFRPRIRPQASGQMFNDDVSGISSTSETFFMERTPLQEKI